MTEKINVSTGSQGQTGINAVSRLNEPAGHHGPTEDNGPIEQDGHVEHDGHTEHSESAEYNAPIEHDGHIEYDESIEHDTILEQSSPIAFQLTGSKETSAASESNNGLLLSFQVITDTHVTEEPEHTHNKNLGRALEDIAALAPETDGIMHAGDVTDHGYPREYEEWNRIWSLHAGKLPLPLTTTGNHDVGLGVWPDRLKKFLEATYMPGAYHDHWIKGYHFIFLGTEKNLRIFCSLSAEQLEWLDRKLGENAEEGKPVFVFLHQPLMNTVSGSYEAQEWYGVTEDQELRAVLSKHPQAILFTGHTHWEMEAPNVHFNGEGKLPYMFNAASVAYLWTDEDVHKDGSQGFFVEVYPDYVQVKGRDFAEGKWLEAVQFRIEWAAGKIL